MLAYPSPNYTERRGGLRPSIVVIHYTAMHSCQEAYERLCDPVHQVSAHWLLGENGQLRAIVDENMRAWHAGVGEWAGITDVNSASIGIELSNRGAMPFSEPQMRVLEVLLQNIMQRWHIPAHRVIGHSDLAPERKRDPGPHFDWRRLALGGLSVWPTPVGVDCAIPDWGIFRAALHRFGYGREWLDQPVISAFRSRFRPWARGDLDAVDMALAADLAARFPVDAPVLRA